MVTAILSVLVVVLYVCGAFLMRSFLKSINTPDRDDWLPVLFWPYFIAAPVIELMIKRRFEW